MDAKEKRAVELAERKFALIAPAVMGTYPDTSMAEYFRRASAEPVGLPDGTRVRLRPSTLASWRRRYLKLGFEGLMPRGRSDLGTSGRIDADLGADIQAMRAEHPKMSAKMAHERLVEEGYVAAGELSVATVQRWFRRHPLAEGDAPQKDRRAFEAGRVNGIWRADTLYGPHVGTPGRRAYPRAIIDDKSRKVVAARFVAHDDAASFQATLKAAVASHGLPERLFVDNGGPYKNGQLSLICGGLGIVLAHAAVRDGAAKGRIERFNRTLGMRFLSVLPDPARESMEAPDAALAKWVGAYNTAVRSSTKAAPSEAFAAEADGLRWLEGGEEALDDAFRNRITRKVAQDATVRVDHVPYDVPMGLVGERVELRWTPGRAGDVWLVMPDGSRRRVAPTDKAANAEAGRAKGPHSIDWGAQEGVA